jgi:biopolymer transport protein ExbD
MKIPSRSRGGGLKFNITPMIDVVFNLIIFFLVASHYARSEAVVDLELPKATGGEAELEQSGRRLTITLPLDGSVYLGGERSSLEEIAARLNANTATHGAGEVEVRIRTDRRVPFSRVNPLLHECSRLGIQRLRFAVLGEN